MNIAIQLRQDSAASFQAIFSFVMRGVRPDLVCLKLRLYGLGQGTGRIFSGFILLNEKHCEVSNVWADVNESLNKPFFPATVSENWLLIHLILYNF